MKQHRVIHKHQLDHGHKRVTLPCSDAKALSVGVSHGRPCLWYDRPYDPVHEGLVLHSRRPAEPCAETLVETLCVFTGEEYCLETEGWRFLDTVIHNPHGDVDIVIHVYVKGF